MNFLPGYRNEETLVSVFAVFFPGFTGMLAGTMFVDQLQVNHLFRLHPAILSEEFLFILKNSETGN